MIMKAEEVMAILDKEFEQNKDFYKAIFSENKASKKSQKNG